MRINLQFIVRPDCSKRCCCFRRAGQLGKASGPRCSDDNVLGCCRLPGSGEDGASADAPSPFPHPLRLAGLVAPSHPLSWKEPSALSLPLRAEDTFLNIPRHAWVTMREESVLSRAHPERSGAADSSVTAADQAGNCVSFLFPAQLGKAITDNVNDAL